MNAQPAGRQWCAPPKLPNFSGESADGPAEDFIREVNRTVQAYEMAEPVAADFVIRHLQGKARREILSRPDESINTPQKIIDILKRIFGDSRPITTLVSGFHSRQQLSGESVLEYAQGLKALEHQINEKAADSIPADMLRDRFIEGLSSIALKRELRRLVREREAMTFDTIRDEALRWTREEEDPVGPTPSIQQHHLSLQTLPEVQELRREMASFAEAMKAVLTTVKTMTERPAPTPVLSLPAIEYPDPAPRVARPRNNGRCYYCNKFGHISRVCQKRRRDEAEKGAHGQQSESGN